MTVCSVGDAFNVDISEMASNQYRCIDCGNEFKGFGKKATCPSCHSANVKKTK